MLSLGATLKKLRQQQGLTQLSLYDGIVSRSFAGRLERGEHDITVEKFWQILDRLQVSADEFRYVQQDNQPTPAQILEAQLDQAYTLKNFPQIRHLEQRYRNSHQVNQRELAIAADLAIKVYDGSQWQLS